MFLSSFQCADAEVFLFFIGSIWKHFQNICFQNPPDREKGSFDKVTQGFLLAKQALYRFSHLQSILLWLF
jgi:hypothetical protein